MLNIYLVRHGQDEDNANGLLNGHRDTPLTQTGIDQANELANKIKESKLDINKVYSSPLQRALKTAKIVCEINSFPDPEVLDLLIEREYGVLTGEPKTRIFELSPNVLVSKTINYFLDPANAETFPDLINRASKLLDFIKSKHTESNILLVTHGDFGKMIYAAYYHLDWRKVLDQFHFGNSEMLLLSPQSSALNSHVFRIKQYNN